MADLIITKKEDMIAIADTVRTKGGSNGQMPLRGIISGINGITGGEDLSAEIAEYAALNDELEEVIDELPSVGTGGGGSSIETCTVKIMVDSDATLYSYGYSQLINGQIEAIYWEGMKSNSTIILENVVCNSLIYADITGISLGVYPTNMSYLNYNYNIYKAPNAGYATGILDCCGDD